MKKLYTSTAGRATRRILIAFAAALFVFSFVSNVPAADLMTEWADASEVQGTFTVLLYGCNSGFDVDNVAILKSEGEGKTLDIVSPAADYVVKYGLEGREALAEAEGFLTCSADLDYTQLSRIVDSEGSVLGFEVKPQYAITRFGTPDVFTTRYTDSGDSISAQITPNPSIERYKDTGD